MEKKNKNEELLHDISAFLEDAGDAVSASETDADGFPFESIDSFDILPIEYEEEQTILLNRTEDLFVLCQRYGRHSKKFLQACAFLDQSIRSLGSICITRIAMIKGGADLPELHQLSTHKLFMMASFNYRKINAALEEEMRDRHEFSMPLMGMLLRYHQTLERLRKTEKKINDINTGKIKITDICKNARTFSEKSPNRFFTAEQNEVPAFREAISFPIDHRELGMRNAECGIDPQELKIGQDSGCRMQEADQLSAGSMQQAAGTPEQLKVENEEWKIEESAALTLDRDKAPVEVSLPEVIGPEEPCMAIEATRNHEEPYIVIQLGNGETICASVQYARFLLENPNIDNHPELKEVLRKFVDDAFTERASP